MDRNIISLKEVTLKDIPLCGGKAANLGELIKLGLNVPKGFVITTEAYKNRKSNNIESEILASFKKLNVKYVAVRSSATAEDASKTSWAGQLETYLFTDKKTLIQNINKCWDSLNSPRASAYQEKIHINPSKVSVAVIVQEMIDADLSGIAFTTHPVTKDNDIILIEAIYGLGEAIVSGMVTPDSYTFSKHKDSTISKETEKQEKKIIGGNKGTEEVLMGIREQCRPKLSDEKIRELAKLCIEIENHYNKPQDIEWCMKDDDIYILQSRPITTL